MGEFEIRAAPAADLPIRLVVHDDLRRSRLTVFFRLLLAIPHFVWIGVWAVGVFVVAIVNWFATLFRGQPPAALHDFLARFVRYAVHVESYVYLAANPFPGFTGDPGRYPIDVEIDPPRRQNRWKVGFRLILAIPAFMLGSALGSGSVSGARGVSSASFGLLATIAFLAWFACLVRGRLTPGFRDLMAYAVGYSAQVLGYALLLTDRYPDSSPRHVAVSEPPPLPVRLTVMDDLRRSRLTVFFRALLAIPLFVWFFLWSIVAWLAAIANWFATLATARSPVALHRFLAAYVRYTTHVTGYLLLTGNPFPGFTGAPGRYPLELEVAGIERQNRWTVGFRFLLAIPALLVQGGLSSAAYAAAFLAWFASLVTGRMPSGLRDLQAVFLRYNANVAAYLFLLTDRYPYSGPVLG